MGQGHCISFLSCIYTGKCLTRPQYTGLAMISKVDAGGLYKYCHLLISPCYLSNSIYKHFAGGNNAENILLSQLEKTFRNRGWLSLNSCMNIEWEEVLVLIDHEGLMFGL